MSGKAPVCWGMPTYPPQQPSPDINPDWAAGTRALHIAVQSSGLWVPSADGGDLTIGMLDYAVSACVQQPQASSPAEGEAPAAAGLEILATPGAVSWGHMRVTCHGDLCRLEEPILRLSIGAIFHAWHYCNTLHRWNLQPPSHVEAESRLDDVKLTGGRTYKPEFFTEIDLDVAQDALSDERASGDLRKWLIITAIPLLDVHGTLVPAPE